MPARGHRGGDRGRGLLQKAPRHARGYLAKNADRPADRRCTTGLRAARARPPRTPCRSARSCPRPCTPARQPPTSMGQGPWPVRRRTRGRGRRPRTRRGGTGGRTAPRRCWMDMAARGPSRHWRGAAGRPILPAPVARQGAAAGASRRCTQGASAWTATPTRTPGSAAAARRGTCRVVQWADEPLHCVRRDAPYRPQRHKAAHGNGRDARHGAAGRSATKSARPGATASAHPGRRLIRAP